MILRVLKAIAIIFGIAVASIAAIVFGTFIGGILLFLGAVATIGVILWGVWFLMFGSIRKR